ncbi:MAG: Alpha/beta hydrolase family protein, partial [Planctomycetaceae bacterium]|nr:Alpha/beta hydrolase family protein [Planctomycetaceae bacterium]
QCALPICSNSRPFRAISVTCDACCATFPLLNKAAGKKIRCKSCGEVIEVPQAGSNLLHNLEDLEEPDNDDIGEDWQPQRLPGQPRKKRSRKLNLSGSKIMAAWGNFLGRTWTHLSVDAVLLGIYGVALLAGFIYPGVWPFLALACGIAGAATLIVGFAYLYLMLIWINIFLIFLLPFLPIVWFVLYFGFFTYYEDTERPRKVILAGVVALLCSVIPGYIGGMAGFAGLNRMQANAPAVQIPAGVPVEPKQTLNTPDEPRGLFKVADVLLPEFVVQPVAQTTPSGVNYVAVQCKPATGDHALPGVNMQMRLYLPRAGAPQRSLGCVLVGPAGSNLISGKPLDPVNAEDEFVPYVRAGMAVLHFSLDGPIDDLQQATDATMSQGYKAFSAAAAGMVNARNAMAFVLLRVPEVDPKRIYIAGHSSAGTLALLFAEHEPTLRGCIAFAPATELPADMKNLALDPRTRNQFPGIESFVTRAAPITHVGTLGCPVFLFHGQGDAVVPIRQSANFANLAKGLGKSVTFSQVPDGHHYQAMAQKGVPQAIEWLRTQFGEPGTGASIPESQPVPMTKPQPPVPSVPMTTPDSLPISKLPVTPKSEPVAKKSQRAMPKSEPAAQKSKPVITPKPEPVAQKPQPVKPNRSLPTAPNPGDRVITLKFSAFEGTGETLEAAQTALTGVSGVDATVMQVNVQERQIVIRTRGETLNPKMLLENLAKAGFSMTSDVRIGAWKP